MASFAAPYKTNDGLSISASTSKLVAAAGTVYAGPLAGNPASATFRKLLASDLPGGTPFFGGFTTNGIMYANSTDSIASTAIGAVDTILTSNGDAAPSYRKVNLQNSTTGVLQLDNGGLGFNASSITQSAFLVGPPNVPITSSPGPPTFRTFSISDFSTDICSGIGLKMPSPACDYIVSTVATSSAANNIGFRMNTTGADYIMNKMTMNTLTSRFTQLNMDTLAHTGGATAAGIAASYLNATAMTTISAKFTTANVNTIIGIGGAAAATQLGELLTPKYSVTCSTVAGLPKVISDAASAAVAEAVGIAASALSLHNLAQEFTINGPGGINPRMNDRTGTGDTYVMKNSPTLTGTITAAALTLSTPLPVTSGGTGIASTSQNYAFLGPLVGTGPPTWRAITSADIPSTGTPVFSSLTPGGAMYAASDSNIVAATNVFMTGTQVGIGATPATGYALDIASTVGGGNIPMVRISGGGGPNNKAGISLTHGALTRPGGDSTKILAHDDGAYSSHLTFYTAPPGNPGNGVATERARFTSGGAFCFGTTTATKNFNISTASTTDTVFIKNTNSAGYGSIHMQNNGTLGMFIGVGGSTATGPQQNIPYIVTTTNSIQLPPTILLSNGTSMALPPITSTSLALTTALPVSSGGTGVSTIAQSYAFLGPISGTGPPTWRAIQPSDIPSTGTPAFSNLNTNGIAYALNTTTLATTIAGTQYQSLIANATGAPTFQALDLGQTASVTGVLPISRGGTGTSAATGTGSLVLSNSPTFTGTLTFNSAVLDTPLAVSSGGTGASSTNQSYAFLGPATGNGAPSWRAITAADLPAAGSPVFSGLTTNGVAYAVNPSTLAATTAGSQYQSLIANATGPPTFQPLDLGQPASITGVMPVLSGGTGTTTATGTGSTVRSINPVLTSTTTINGGSSVALAVSAARDSDVMLIKNINAGGFGCIEFQNDGIERNLFIGVGGSTTHIENRDQAYIKATGDKGLHIESSLRITGGETINSGDNVPLIINTSYPGDSIQVKTTTVDHQASIQLENDVGKKAIMYMASSTQAGSNNQPGIYVSDPSKGFRINTSIIQQESLHTVIVNWQSSGHVYRYVGNGGGLNVSGYVPYPIGTEGYYYFGPSGTTHNYGSLTVNPLANGGGTPPYWLMPVTGIYSVKWRWTPSPFYNKACIVKNLYGSEYEHWFRGDPNLLATNFGYYYRGAGGDTAVAGMEICATFHATVTDRIYFSQYEGNFAQNTQQPQNNGDTSWRLEFTLIQRTG